MECPRRRLLARGRGAGLRLARAVGAWEAAKAKDTAWSLGPVASCVVANCASFGWCMDRLLPSSPRRIDPHAPA